jgi:hypothetical protein
VVVVGGGGGDGGGGARAARRRPPGGVAAAAPALGAARAARSRGRGARCEKNGGSLWLARAVTQALPFRAQKRAVAIYLPSFGAKEAWEPRESLGERGTADRRDYRTLSS